MSNIVPFVDLKQQYINHRDKFEKAISDVCLKSSYVLGREVENFEIRFADYLGVKETVGVNSGTDALILTSIALGIGPGDEVLVPANTFIASALGIYSAGATIVPVDVDEESFLMDFSDAESRITDKTKAIVAVHLFGQSINMDVLMDFAEKYNLLVIEDACQSHGAVWKGKRTGSFGAAGCFSFYPAKNLGAFGDGGLIATNDSSLAVELRLLRNYGSMEKHVHKIPGTNSRLDSLQAAILNVKLDFLDSFNKRRYSAACMYADALNDIKSVKMPVFDSDDTARHVFHLFVIRCERRDELMKFLNEKGIQCGIHYPVPVHHHRAFETLNLNKSSLPVAEKLAGEILSLPIYPEISNEQICRVVDHIKIFYGE